MILNIKFCVVWTHSFDVKLFEAVDQSGEAYGRWVRACKTSPIKSVSFIKGLHI